MGKLPEYKFLESICEPNDTCPIEILDGEFKNIIYKYGKISIKENGEELSVNMDITIVSGPEEFNQEDKNFTQVVGEIFVDIVEKNSAISLDKDEQVDLEDDVHSD